MKQSLLFFTVFIFLSFSIYAQKDTIDVDGFYTTQQYGTLNDAIEAARAEGTINDKVFKLAPYDVYVLSRSIFMSFGENLEIVAPKPGNTLESAPPQIVWTEEDIDKTYLIQTYGDVTMKNIWIRFDDFSGIQRQTGIVFEDSAAVQGDDVEKGYFEGCIFDYSQIGSEAGGSITVKADHFVGIFKDCYFRNLSDYHFQYYGRAVSFPYQSSGFHYDSLLFENCTFSNLSRIVMQEGNEYGDNIHINHCTLINSIEWVYQSAGWLRNTSITNSIFVNPYMMGYRALDVCDMGEDGTQDYDDFEDGLCDPPGGGLINGLTEVDSFEFAVDFTDFDRKLFVGNNVYMYQDWYLNYTTECDWCAEQIRTRHPEEIRHPAPMIGDNALAIIDSTDGDGNKVFNKMNVDWSTIYTDDPDFIVAPTNEDTLKMFLEGKWGTGLDIDWAYQPNATFAQTWPLPENLAYNNAAYKTAAMGQFPLGDLNWYPDEKELWEAQRDEEWVTINNWLNSGDPNVGVKEVVGTPSEYSLSQNYPNPFNPTTQINYSIPEAVQVSLKVFNTLGQEVAVIHQGFQQAGNYVATYNGAGLSSGVYIYRLQAGDIAISKEFVLIK